MTKSKTVEIEKVHVIRSILVKALQNIGKSFPEIDALPLYYKELIKLTLDYVQLKKSLGSMRWAYLRIEEFSNKTTVKMKKAATITFINNARREYYGRVSSIMRQINEYLIYLEEARRMMKSYPDIKEDFITVALCGLPNVGKSTLLKSLTSANPEIKSYPFTTKTLNMGYFRTQTRAYQIIDTPGALDRPLEKSNEIEKQAYLALNLITDMVIFVFDPSETSGYTLEEQYNVFSKILEFPVIKQKGLKILLVLNKSDLKAERKKELLDKLEKKKKEKKALWNIFEISAANQQCIDKVKEEILLMKPQRSLE